MNHPRVPINTLTTAEAPTATDVALTIFRRLPRFENTVTVVRNTHPSRAAATEWELTADVRMSSGATSFHVTTESDDPSDGQPSRLFLVTVEEV